MLQFDYHQIGYRKSDLVKIRYAAKWRTGWCFILWFTAAMLYDFGKKNLRETEELIPRQQFEIKIQAVYWCKSYCPGNTECLAKRRYR